jgi:hypothetical protein
MTPFQQGCLSYRADFKSEITKDVVELSQWEQGYLAFSQTEEMFDKSTAKGLYALLDKSGKIESPDKGYLMEVNLWKQDRQCLYEIAIEREDRGFFVQRWQLHTQGTPAADQMLCYYRERPMLARANTVLKNQQLQACEVICPQHRLHFFLTKGA